MMNAPKVMVVDDDPGLLRLLSMQLEAAGYKAVCAASAEEALRSCRPRGRRRW
jgi:CheY-like chemotaxis protein